MASKTKTFREKFLTVGLLYVLVISAFFTRVHHFEINPSGWRTIDEMVYFSLALNLKQEGFAGYNTRRYVQSLIEEAPERATTLPSYFYKPLFKHPPLFPLAIAGALTVFGENDLSADYVSALFGALLILVGYFIGKLYFDEMTGHLAAFFLWMDPNATMCSQKIWMDTMMAFFMGLGILWFGYGLKEKKSGWFIPGGIALGLAGLTKYPGILPLAGVVFYALFFDIRMFRDKKFIAGLAAPLVMMSPWIGWNFKVYGLSALAAQSSLHLDWKSSHVKTLVAISILAAGLIITKMMRFFSKNDPGPQIDSEIFEDETRQTDRFNPKRVLIMVYGLTFFYFLAPYVLRAVDFFSMPLTTWNPDSFRDPLFYFGRLIEFSVIHAFAFASVFMLQEKVLEKAVFLYLQLVMIFLFFLAWGSFQSRYILSAVPLLAVIGVQMAREIWDWNGKKRYGHWLVKALLVLILVWGILKTNYINFMVSFPNDMCYF